MQLRKTEKGTQQKHVTEVEIDNKKGAYPPDPTESAVHGREIYVTKQKQTQKEKVGDLEITRNITATETTDVEHKAKTSERLVQGQVLPSNPPFFTKKSNHAELSKMILPNLKLNLTEIHCQLLNGSVKTFQLQVLRT